MKTAKRHNRQTAELRAAHPTPVTLLLRASCLLAAWAVLKCGATLEGSGDGLRKVEVKRFGVSVRVPQAWSLIAWAQDDKAFVLRLPQEPGSPAGHVACELGVAPESLEEFRKRHEAADAEEQNEPHPRRKLLENRIEPLEGEPVGQAEAARISQRLVCVWQHTGEDGRTWYEARVHMIRHDTLYTFRLTSDEAHFLAYRLDFEEMVARAAFTPPETGLQRLPGGYWMQREFHFALQLPEGWKPAFGPRDKVLLFATGQTHEVFTDNLLVLASRAQPLDLDQLQKTFPEAIAQVDPAADVAVCRIVPQGTGAALETVVHTARGPFEITVLERRFQGNERNYEVKFTCETSQFKKIEEQLRKSLDSFRELEEQPKRLL